MIGVSPLRRLRCAWNEMARAVREDHAVLHHYDAKYGAGARGARPALAGDLVTRVGFQLIVACRVMRFFADAGLPLAPRIASRMIRHTYGADVHWEAILEPGIVLVHGMGLAVSRAARVQRGAILFQNVTLGMGIDPATRKVGAPNVECDVHVGAGSTVIGPITLGARSKVTANCLVRTSVPPDSLVEAPPPTISIRPRRQTRSGSDIDS